MRNPKSLEDCQQLVEELLQLAGNDCPYDDKLMQVIWQRGYLTGMLARIIHENPQIKSAMLRNLDQRKFNKKK